MKIKDLRAKATEDSNSNQTWGDTLPAERQRDLDHVEVERYMFKDKINSFYISNLNLNCCIFVSFFKLSLGASFHLYVLAVVDSASFSSDQSLLSDASCLGEVNVKLQRLPMPIQNSVRMSGQERPVLFLSRLTVLCLLYWHPVGLHCSRACDIKIQWKVD